MKDCLIFLVNGVQTSGSQSYAARSLGYCECIDWVDFSPVVVIRVQDVGPGDSDVIVDAGYCDIVCVVLAG